MIQLRKKETNKPDIIIFTFEQLLLKSHPHSGLCHFDIDRFDSKAKYITVDFSRFSPEAKHSIETSDPLPTELPVP